MISHGFYSWESISHTYSYKQQNMQNTVSETLFILKFKQNRIYMLKITSVIFKTEKKAMTYIILKTYNINSTSLSFHLLWLINGFYINHMALRPFWSRVHPIIIWFVSLYFYLFYAKLYVNSGVETGVVDFFLLFVPFSVFPYGFLSHPHLPSGFFF